MTYNEIITKRLEKRPSDMRKFRAARKDPAVFNAVHALESIDKNCQVLSRRHKRRLGDGLKDISESEVDNKQSINEDEKLESDNETSDVPTTLRNGSSERCSDQIPSNTPKIRSRKLLADGRRKFICNICGAALLTAPYLARHLRSHKGEYCFECSVCHLTFLYHSHLEIHMLRHSKQQSYKCSVCGDTFAENYTLKVHLQSHLPSLTRVCQVCKAGFATKDELKRHKLCHAKQVVKCDMCEALFVRRQSLTSHLQARDVRQIVPENKSGLACLDCNVIFYSLCGKKKHFQTHHFQAERNMKSKCTEKTILQGERPIVPVENLWTAKGGDEIIIEKMEIKEETEKESDADEKRNKFVESDSLSDWANDC